MAIIEESIEINCPVEQAFNYMQNFQNLRQWEVSILEIEQTSPGKLGVGTTFRGANRVMGMRMAWTAQVTVYEPNKKYGESIKSGSSRLNNQLTFNAAGQGTKITMMMDLKVGGFLKLLAPMIAGSMRKDGKENLARLKNNLEKS